MMLNKLKSLHLQRGQQAEQQAYQYLVDRGFILLCRNYRTRQGEVDLIMHDDNTLVMIEVRYRKSNKYGSAVESITKKKQSRIISAAKHYLVTNNINDQAVRFDVIAISGNNNLNWIPNAFQTTF